MTHWPKLHHESKERWETIANYWDNYMGVHSNRFHRELIRPYTEKLLNIESTSVVLDIACGNGNFSRRLDELGATVTAVDYSSTMIEKAKARTPDDANINYKVLDATQLEQLLELGQASYSHAVCNMGLMDISDVRPLAHALKQLLIENGLFVFSIAHPSFQTPTTRHLSGELDVNKQLVIPPSIQIYDYLTPASYTDYGLRNQPVPHYMFHRPLQFYMNLFFETGFVLDGFMETSFELADENVEAFEWTTIPAVAIFRFRKLEK